MEERKDREAKRRYWRDRLREWKESGLSQVAYCARNNLSRDSFNYWKRKLKAAGESARFVEVAILKPSATVLTRRSPLRLRITDAYWIEIERDFDRESLNRLIDVLEGR